MRMTNKRNRIGWFEEKQSRKKILQKLYAICIYIEITEKKIYVALAQSVVFKRILCDSCYNSVSSVWSFNLYIWSNQTLFFLCFSIYLSIFVHQIIFRWHLAFPIRKQMDAPKHFISRNGFNRRDMPYKVS